MIINPLVPGTATYADVVASLRVFLVAALISGITVTLLASGLPVLRSHDLDVTIVMLLSFGATLVPAINIYRRRGLPYRSSESGHERPGALRAVTLSLSVFGLSPVLGYLWQFVTTAGLGGVSGLAVGPNHVVESPAIWMMALFAVLGCIVGPMFEEVLLRGIVLPAVAAKNGLATAVMLNALISGFSHFGQSNVLSAALLGAVSSILAITTCGIRLSVIAHVTYNVGAAASRVLAPISWRGPNQELLEPALIIVTLVSGITLAGLIRRMWRQMMKNNPRELVSSGPIASSRQLRRR